MKRTPLKRTRGWPQGRSARKLVKRTQKKQDLIDELDAVTDDLLKRAGYRCEVCRVKRVEHRHHRRRQSQGGTNDLDNLLAVCHLCHEFIHHHPALSYENGWLLRNSVFSVDMDGGKGLH